MDIAFKLKLIYDSLEAIRLTILTTDDNVKNFERIILCQDLLRYILVDDLKGNPDAF